MNDTGFYSAWMHGDPSAENVNANPMLKERSNSTLMRRIQSGEKLSDILASEPTRDDRAKAFREVLASMESRANALKATSNDNVRDTA